MDSEEDSTGSENRSSGSSKGTEPHPKINGSGDRLDEEKIAAPVSETNPEAPPDGGVLAWTQVACALWIWFSTWGLINSFGAFQKYYATELLRDETPSNIAWIGSVQAFLLMLGGSLAGPLFDRGYLRHLVAAGSFFVTFGLFMTSLARNEWQIFLAQGVTVGIGSGLLFVPSVSTILIYFSKKRALAMGMTACGSSVGGIVYSAMMNRLIPEVGFPWAVRIVAFVVMVTFIPPNVGLRQRALPPIKRKLFDYSALKRPAFTVYICSALFSFMGVFIPFFYLELFAVENMIGSPSLQLYSPALLNTGSFFGRLIPGLFAYRFGFLNSLTGLVCLSGIVAFTWASITNEGELIAWALSYGLCSGAQLSLTPTIIASALAPNLMVLGTLSGMMTFMCALGVLIGNPIAGALHDRGWIAIETFCGTCLIVTAIMLLVVRVLLKGWALKAWV